MSNIIKILSDREEVFDKMNKHVYAPNGISDTDIEIVVKSVATGKTLFSHREKNKVILPGSIYTACLHHPVVSPIQLPSYNTAMNLDNSVLTDPEKPEYIYLFCIGLDGCGDEASQKFEVNYGKWLAPADMIAFKYASTDISDDERNKYFGRKYLSDLGIYSYWFKGFEAAPNMTITYADGTPVDANVYASSNPQAITTMVELKLRVTNEDGRDFFKATTGISTAKVNTVQLCRAWPKIIDGYTYYQNIQPVTKLNMNNEPLEDETKGIDIYYHLYY